jgi:methylmalonyl-CoA carboxyltransferase small subunit
VKLKITVDGETYEVEVEAVEPEAAPVLPRGYVTQPASIQVPAAPPRPASPADEERVCRSPISGVVVRIAVQPGQTLQVGDILLVLEAMKMETNITSPVAGKIAAIKVRQGDAVQAGEVVAEFE